MTKNEKEASKYKDLSDKELLKVINGYKSLSKSNSDICNFLFTFIILVLGTFLFAKITVTNIVLVILIHYLFFWLYLHKYKKLKLVSDEDKEDIDEIIVILESYLKDRKTKNPSE